MSGRRTADRDRGSATVLAVGAIAALLVVAGAAVMVAAAIVVRHRATAAADLSALAAATTAVGGEQVSCARAEWVARQMGTTLARCQLDGWDAVVEVSASMGAMVPMVPFDIKTNAHARAGPVER